MKKTYKIDVDCANCANKMEQAAKDTAGVKDAVVNFMTLKMCESRHAGSAQKLQESGRRLRDISVGYDFQTVIEKRNKT